MGHNGMKTKVLISTKGLVKHLNVILYWFSVNWKFAFGALAWFRDKDDHS